MNHTLSNMLNFAVSSALLTATGTETVYDTTVTLTFSIGGKAYALTAVTDGATPTTDAVTGAALTLAGTTTTGQCAVVVWCVDKDGTVKCLHGEKVSVNYYGNLDTQPEFPNIPNTLVPFAYQVCKHYNQATTFTFGSSNWDTTGFTGTIVNVFTLPSRPQTS